MRILEVRRHTLRTKPGEHLSQAGVTLARRVGEGIGPFDRVVTTLAPRAFETAIALGFAVDEQPNDFPQMGDDGEREVAWDAGYAAWSRAVRLGGAAARYARGEAACWRRIVQTVPEGGRALLVTHGGVIEAGTAACLPSGAHTTLEASCNYCEGVRLSFDGANWVDIEVQKIEFPVVAPQARPSRVVGGDDARHR